VSFQNNLLLSGGGDDIANIFSPQSQLPVFQLIGHSDTVQQIRMNYLNDLIATASMDATVKIWDVKG